MPDETRADSGEFDLRTASAKLNPFRKRLRRDSVIGIVFLVGFGILIFGVSRSSIIHGTVSRFQEFELTVVAIIVVGGIAGLSWQMKRQIPGPVSLRVGDRGLDLTYPSGRHVIVYWSDRQLDFKLLDFTGADPRVLRTSDYPFRISIHGIESLLTNEAYQALTDEIGRQGLYCKEERGGTWLHPAKANPIVRRFRARGTSPATS